MEPRPVWLQFFQTNVGPWVPDLAELKPPAERGRRYSAQLDAAQIVLLGDPDALAGGW